MSNARITTRSFRLFVAMTAGLSLLLASVAKAADPTELVFVFQKQKEPDALRDQSEKLSAELSKRLGMPVRAVVPQDYAASVQALASGKADVAYVSSLPFLLARRDAGAKLLLVEERPDAKGVFRTDYDSVFVSRTDSTITDFRAISDNPKNIRMCFTSRTSTSGFVFPALRLLNEKLLTSGQDPKDIFKEVSFAGSYSLALRQVLDGRSDVAAVSDYTVEGPGATSYVSADELKQLRVVSRTPGVPTHLICVRPGLSEALQARIKQALLDVSRQSPEMLNDVYGTSRFVEADEDKHVQSAIDAVNAVGLPLENLAR